MIIYIPDEGRLANKLWMAVKLLVVHLESGETVLYPAFGEYRHCFDATARDGFILNTNGRAPGLRCLSAGLKLLCRVYYHTRSYRENASRLNFIDSLCHDRRRHLKVTNGWLKFNDGSLLTRHKHGIRRFFKPCDRHWLRSTAVIDSVRKGSDVVIGVHVRRTDYAMWENGTYHFDDAHYRHYMGQVESLFPGSTVTFVICSDEPVCLDAFREYAVVAASNHFVEDLYTLSMCDCIIGPPSTYSAWASFYGDVPLYRIGTEKSPLERSDFSIIGS